jgi:hypothetical protein
MSLPTDFWYRNSVATIAAFSLIFATGCGAKTTAINGTVTYQGRHLTGGSVIVYCQNQQIVRGIIDSEGHYTIPNVPTGTAMVTVHSHTPIPAGFQLRQTLPPVNNGPISPSVDASKPGDAVIIPERYTVPEESGLALNVDRNNLEFNIDLKP